MVPFSLRWSKRKRIAIAGVFAMKPGLYCSSMNQRPCSIQKVVEVLETVHKLNKEEGITIVFITHFMEEAVTADRVVVMKNGVKLHDGTPS